MKPIITFIFCLVILESKAQDPPTYKQCQNLLNGSWAWYQTTNEFRGSIENRYETPATCHCTKKIVFKKNWILEYYSNDTLVSASNYTIERSGSGREEVFILRNDHFTGELKFRSDTLGIGWFGICAKLNY